MLLSHLTAQKPKAMPPAAAKRSIVMASLEAAMGRRYTNIVEEFLAADDKVKETEANEHEFALSLEMRARDTIQDIAAAI